MAETLLHILLFPFRLFGFKIDIINVNKKANDMYQNADKSPVNWQLRDELIKSGKRQVPAEIKYIKGMLDDLDSSDTTLYRLACTLENQARRIHAIDSANHTA
jgi:hypothetical protein